MDAVVLDSLIVFGSSLHEITIMLMNKTKTTGLLLNICVISDDL